MKIAEELAMKGRLTIQKLNHDGQLLEEIKADNWIVYTGRDLVAQLFIKPKDIPPIQYLAVGTGSNPVDPIKDTKLQAEVFRKKINPVDLSKDLQDTPEKDVPVDNGSIKQKNRLVRISADLDFAEPDPSKNNNKPYELREAGLFNAEAASGGIMYNRVVFPPISKTKDFKLTLIWEIIF
jgi:hypothetical protein